MERMHDIITNGTRSLSFISLLVCKLEIRNAIVTYALIRHIYTVWET